MATKTQKSRKGQTIKISKKKGKIKEDKDITEPISSFQEQKTGRKDITHPVSGANIEISKIKLRNDLFLTVIFIKSFEGDKVRNPVTEEMNWPVHDDLKAAFDSFIPHFAIIAGYENDKKIKGKISDMVEKLSPTFAVKQVALGSNADGVTITGNHTVKGKKVNFNAPYTKFYETGTDAHKFGTDLQIAWDELVRETIEYINGKHGTPVQTEMNFEGDKEPEDLPFAEEEL